MSPRQELKTLVDCDAFRIRASQKEGEHLVISFASIGKGFHLPPPDEFVGTLQSMENHWGIFVSDTRRTWMNSLEFTQCLTQVLNEQIEAKKPKTVATLGLSLGAFSALVAPSMIPVTHAIALSPQYSVSQDVMPDETRWRFWTRKIPEFNRLTVRPLVSETKFYVLHGLVDDHQHMQRFPKQRNLRHFVFPDVEHSQIGKLLKQKGKLQPFLKAAMQDEKRAVSRLLRPLGGLWRGKYEKSLAQNATTEPKTATEPNDLIKPRKNQK